MMLDETRQALPGVNLVLMEPFILPVGVVAEKFNQWQELIIPIQQMLPGLAADYNAAFVPLQQKFNKLCDAIIAAGIRIPMKTLANSASIMELPTVHFDACRAGIILYGLYPSNEVDRNQLDLKPVMSVKVWLFIW